MGNRKVRPKNFLCLAGITLLLSGCVTTTAHPSFAEAHPKIRKLAIIPPEVVVGNITSGNEGAESTPVAVRIEDRESIYRQSVVDDQVLLFGTKGYKIDSRLLKLFEEGSTNFKKHYLEFINAYKNQYQSSESFEPYSPISRSLPIHTGGQKQFEVGLQEALKPLEQYTDADAFVFVRFGKISYDPTSIVTHIFTTALFGFMFVDDKATLELACIERGTGRLLWRSGFRTYQEYFVHFKNLVADFPDAAGSTTARN